MAGTLTNVRVEPGNVVGVGDVVYLSETIPGYVTSQKPLTYIQDVGRALTAGDSTTVIEMLFFPRAMLSTSIKGTIYTSDWTLLSGNYYHDIDITGLDSTGTAIVTSFWADAGAGAIELLQPSQVQLLSSGGGLYDKLRVWMSTNTLDVWYNLSSGVGVPTTVGGGSGTTDHSMLLNLGPWGSTGHEGVFAQYPHGPDAHNFPPDIPSGSIILFEADTAVTGYTLLTDVDDELVYITKGSAAGGEMGGIDRTDSSWTQPVHAHIITPDGSVHTHVIADDGSHNHKWKDYIPGAPDVERTWDVSGNDIDLDSGSTGANDEGIIVTDSGGTPKTIDDDFYTQIDGLHDHGGLTSPGDDEHNHGGFTMESATDPSWRPLGRTYTRQQKD